MASPTNAESPHLVALVLQSKKALQHGEQLCLRARDISRESTCEALDFLAVEAKVKWFSQAVLEQLQIAMSVVKSIEQKRTHLERRAQEWDTTRTKRVDELDEVLESLGTQVVPPDFHQASSASSIFGSQHSDDEVDDGEGRMNGERQLGSSSIQRTPTNKKPPTSKFLERAKWKTLRDFVDERAIEDAIELMDTDRTQLDDILSATGGDPVTLKEHIAAIQAAIPESSKIFMIENVLHAQAAASTALAKHLESLAAHYDQMAEALHEKEAGEEFSEEDLQAMNRDTEELPAIITDLEGDATSIETTHQQLMEQKAFVVQNLDAYMIILEDLEELGEIMSNMLEQQRKVELEFSDQLSLLDQHLSQIEVLHVKYTSYRAAYSHLLVEMRRRTQYSEAAEHIVQGMKAQLEAMTDEEQRLREQFYIAYGGYLPYDLCLSIQNPPTKWVVGPAPNESKEALPGVADDLFAEAQAKIASNDSGGDGLSGSLSM